MRWTATRRSSLILFNTGRLGNGRPLGPANLSAEWKFYVSIDIVDSTGKRISGAGVNDDSSAGSVAYQPVDIAEQAPQPIQLEALRHPSHHFFA